eukprot:15461398-Alexandrium_andersonii.AAC.1
MASAGHFLRRSAGSSLQDAGRLLARRGLTHSATGSAPKQAHLPKDSLMNAENLPEQHVSDSALRGGAIGVGKWASDG